MSGRLVVVALPGASAEEFSQRAGDGRLPNVAALGSPATITPADGEEFVTWDVLATGASVHADGARHAPSIRWSSEAAGLATASLAFPGSANRHEPVDSGPASWFIDDALLVHNGKSHPMLVPSSACSAAARELLVEAHRLPSDFPRDHLISLVPDLAHVTDLAALTPADRVRLETIAASLARTVTLHALATHLAEHAEPRLLTTAIDLPAALPAGPTWPFGDSCRDQGWAFVDTMIGRLRELAPGVPMLVVAGPPAYAADRATESWAVVGSGGLVDANITVTAVDHLSRRCFDAVGLAPASPEGAIGAGAMDDDAQFARDQAATAWVAGRWPQRAGV